MLRRIVPIIDVFYLCKTIGMYPYLFNYPFCACVNNIDNLIYSENLLTNNLVRRKDELVQALQEISVEDRHQQLENAINDLKVNLAA